MYKKSIFYRSGSRISRFEYSRETDEQRDYVKYRGRSTCGNPRDAGTRPDGEPITRADGCLRERFEL